MIQIKVRLFGAFRRYETNQVFVAIEVPESSSVEVVKNSIASYFRAKFENFSDGQLIEDSVIADESHVLGANEIIEQSCTLAILPPVCGG